jgi:hypothetical protein
MNRQILIARLAKAGIEIVNGQIRLADAVNFIADAETGEPIYSPEEVIDEWRQHDHDFQDGDNNFHLPIIKKHPEWALREIPVRDLKLRHGWHGVMNPENAKFIADEKLVRELPPIIAVWENGHFLVLDGEHRSWAAREMGIDTIEAFVPADSP